MPGQTVKLDRICLLVLSPIHQHSESPPSKVNYGVLGRRTTVNQVALTSIILQLSVYRPAYALAAVALWLVLNRNQNPRSKL